MVTSGTTGTGFLMIESPVFFLAYGPALARLQALGKGDVEPPPLLSDIWRSWVRCGVACVVSLS